MKLLILGGNGMAGHVMVRYYSQKPGYEVFYTSRDEGDADAIPLDARDLDQIERVLELVQPDTVINCIGILNDRAAQNELEAFRLNGLLPHQLRRLAERIGSKLVHISTDCVFSGDRGDYTEDDLPDGTTVYARTKAIGEVRHDRHLTVRTSIIGPEIRTNRIGLLDWFLSQHGEVRGYRRVIWNGVTTLELAKAIGAMLEQNLSGLYQLTAPEKLSKYELLLKFRDVFGKADVTIVPDDAIVQDRSLRTIRTDFAYKVPGCDVMLAELAVWMAES